MTAQNAISRKKRNPPPANYSLKIESFSLLKGSVVERFESGIFESGGYKWSLVFYPKGKIKADGKDHLSLYLKIDDSNSHPNGAWEVHVYYKLFAYDQLSNQYLVVQDAESRMRGFNRNKNEWGFGKFLHLSTFEEPSNGYLVDDTCVFGAEVFVVNQTSTEQILSFVTEPVDGTRSLSIPSFFEKDQHKNEFTVGERKWQLVVHPTGFGPDRGNHLTISLNLADYATVLKPVYAEFKLKVVNRFNENIRKEQTIKHFFNSPVEKASSKLIALKELYDVSSGYYCDGIVIVEVQFLVFSKIKIKNLHSNSGIYLLLVLCLLILYLVMRNPKEKKVIQCTPR